MKKTDLPAIARTSLEPHEMDSAVWDSKRKAEVVDIDGRLFIIVDDDDDDRHKDNPSSNDNALWKLKPAPSGSGKKWQVTIPGKGGRTKTVKFGARGYEDYTQHKDKSRRKNYRSRHQNDNLDDPRSAGFWSWYVLWGDTTDRNKAFASAVRRAKKLLPRDNPPNDLGERVREAAASDEAFEALDLAGLESFQTGGCASLAAAVERVYGLPQVVVGSDLNPAEHVVNAYAGGYIDSDGWQTEEQLFRKLDREAGPRSWYIEDSSAAHLFACPVDVVRALAALLPKENPPVVEYPQLQPSPFQGSAEDIRVEEIGQIDNEPLFLVEVTPWGESRHFYLKEGSSDPYTWDGLLAEADAMLQYADQIPLPNKAFKYIQAATEVLEMGNVSVISSRRGEGLAPVLYKALLDRYDFIVSDRTVSKGAMRVWEKLLKTPGVDGQASRKAPRNWATSLPKQNPKPGAGAGVLFVTPAREMLLLRRFGGSYEGCWDLPGGTVEPGETPRQGAFREAAEEIGAFGKADRDLGDVVMQDPKSGFTYTTFVALVSEPFNVRLNDEHDAWGWFTVDDAVSMDLHPGLAELLGSVDPWSL